MDGDTVARVAYLLLLLVAVGGWVLAEYRQRLGLALRTALAWGLIFLGAAAGYGLWQDLRSDGRAAQIVSETGEVKLLRDANGHFYATLTIGGTEVQFLADTGATNVVLSQDDARRLGFLPEDLLYLGEAATANGTVRTARVTLRSVEFGPFQDESLDAYVSEGAMEGSLLGMDYLSRFRIGISGDRMVLTR